MLRQRNYPDYFRGCLVGIAAGDALGVPVETMTHEQILEATGGKGVQGLIAPIQRRIEDTMDLPAGSTSDDTQLAFSLAQSIIDSEGLDLGDIAKKLVTEYQANRFGWGGTTKRAVAGLVEYADTGRKSGRSPLVYLTPHTGFDDKRCGNGVAMRIAPFGLWHGANGHRIDDLVHHVYMIGRMTHDDPRASIAAVAIAAAVSHLLYHGHATGGDDWFFRKSVMDAVRHAEEKFVTGRKVLSDRLQYAYALTGTPDLLRKEIGAGCFALESVPFAIGTFLRHPKDALAGMLEAVNAGGDTDTVASMVGAMIGTNIGLSNFPAMFDTVDATGRAVDLGTELHDMCNRTGAPRS